MKQEQRGIVPNIMSNSIHSIFKNFIFFSTCLILLSSCKKDRSNIDPQKYADNDVGYSANDLLASDNFTSLVVQIVHVEGFAPHSGSIDDLEDFLSARVNKPGGISVKTKSISSPGLAPFSISDLSQVESNSRSRYNDEKELTVYVLYADGDYTNTNVLGVAYKNTSCAIFAKKTRENSGGLGQPSRRVLESTVLLHEIGHLLGLTDIGTEAQSDHVDDAHPGHCDVEDCLMFWAVETGDVITNLIGASEPPNLDSQCIADLRANGGK